WRSLEQQMVREGRWGFNLGNVLGGGSIIRLVKNFFILWAMLLGSVAWAQPSQVAVDFLPNTKTLVAGQQAVVAVVMDIKEGFHAQSHRPLSENYIAT